MKYILTIIIAIFLFSCSSQGIGNAESNCEPKWYNYNEVGFLGKLLGKKDYISNKGTLYGRGFHRAFDRNSSKRMATANARLAILDEFNQDFIADLIKESEEGANLLGKKYSDVLIQTFEDNFKASIEAGCRMCFVIKFEDCYNNGKWDSFALVELDIDNWKDEEFQTLLESTIQELDIKDEEAPAFNAPS